MKQLTPPSIAESMILSPAPFGSRKKRESPSGVKLAPSAEHAASNKWESFAGAFSSAGSPKPSETLAPAT